MPNIYQCSQIRLSTALLLVSLFGFSSTSSIAKSGSDTSQERGPQQKPPASEVDTLVQAASQAYQDGKLDEALAYCTKAIALNPNEFRAHALAGLVYAAQWKMKSASAAYANVIRLKPQLKEFYVLKAEADISLGDLDEAITLCEEALKLDPNFAEAYATIGAALEHTEQRQSEAISAYQSAIQIDPKLFRVYDSLGQLFLNLKDEKSAEKIFRQGMAADPKHMSGRFQLGRLFVQQGKLVEARQLWNERTSDEDRFQPTFIQLLTRAENMKRATELLAKNPNDPDALNDMGLAVLDGDSWVVDHRQERAIVFFTKALQLRPQFARAQCNIVKAMIQYLGETGKDKQTVDKELAKLRQLDPALAAEMEQYRKTYQSGLIGTPINVKQ
ncbi:MAG TPA: tetratricopeptide repeat protein [Pyrinomonadaceae bacterium]|jgi:tetratricopeptide (TPR) repeat protein|nr:tetratricopeptide repeat protein [Pyrinomonadaceae bacterium]